MRTVTGFFAALSAMLLIEAGHAQSSIADWMKLDPEKLAPLTGAADYSGWISAAEPTAKIDLHAIAEKTTAAKWGGSGSAFRSQIFYSQPNTLPANQPRITKTITEGNRIIALVLTAPMRASWSLTEWKAAGFAPGTSPLQKQSGHGRGGNEILQYHQWKQDLAANDSVFASVSGFDSNFGTATISRDQRIPTDFLPETTPAIVVEWLQDQRPGSEQISINVMFPGAPALADALHQVGFAPGSFETVARGSMTEVKPKSGYLATKRFPTYFVNSRGERELMGESGFRVTAFQAGSRLQLTVTSPR